MIWECSFKLHTTKARNSAHVLWTSWHLCCCGYIYCWNKTVFYFLPGHILTSPIASSLPTLPFTVLKSLFDASPLTTDDGVLLRRMGLDIGVLHLVLACLSVLSHHGPRVPVSGFQQEVSLLSYVWTCRFFGCMLTKGKWNQS